MIDYLIVGTGLFGAVFAHEAAKKGKRCLAIDRRSQPGGNIYCRNVSGIQVHEYGAHIFHTADRKIWDYVNSLCDFHPFINSPLANYKGEIYNLPFNMNTFNRMWGVITPDEAKAKIRQQIAESGITKPNNLEEQAILLVGRELYEKLIKGYTEKQWGRDCKDLPAFIINRVPLRFTYDNNYFNDPYQGIPDGGYNCVTERLLADAEVVLDCDYIENRKELSKVATKIIFTGSLDQYYDYTYGNLEYRSLRFDSELLAQPDFQGNAVVNYTDRETPFTRILEHKHFGCGGGDSTVITREYPVEWKPGMEPYYPVNDEKNQALYQRYQALAAAEKNVLFGGRLAEYRYYDMDKVIASALALAEREL